MRPSLRLLIYLPVCPPPGKLGRVISSGNGLPRWVWVGGDLGTGLLLRSRRGDKGRLVQEVTLAKSLLFGPWFPRLGEEGWDP